MPAPIIATVVSTIIAYSQAYRRRKLKGHFLTSFRTPPHAKRSRSTRLLLPMRGNMPTATSDESGQGLHLASSNALWPDGHEMRVKCPCGRHINQAVGHTMADPFEEITPEFQRGWDAAL